MCSAAEVRVHRKPGPRTRVQPRERLWAERGGTDVMNGFAA
jgi:hypothetical protein